MASGGRLRDFGGDSENSEGRISTARRSSVSVLCYCPDLSVILLSRALELELARLLRTICKLTGGRRSFRRRLFKGPTRGRSPRGCCFVLKESVFDALFEPSDGGAP
jgi:hypothetical protein